LKLDQKVAYLAQHNVDSGAWHTDPMHEACQPHQTPSMGLNSRNVKRSYNGRKAAKAGLGVTGGFVQGSDVGQVKAHKGNSKHAMRRLAKGTQRNRYAA
jgi:hypothetical protein